MTMWHCALVVAVIGFWQSGEHRFWFTMGFSSVSLVYLGLMIEFRDHAMKMGTKWATDKIDAIIDGVRSGKGYSARFKTEEITPDGPITKYETANVTFEVVSVQYEDDGLEEYYGK